MKKPEFSEYGKQTFFGVTLSAAVCAAVLLFARVSSNGAPNTAALPSRFEPQSVDALLDAREESRLMEEESSRRAAQAATEEASGNASQEGMIKKEPGNGDPSVWSQFHDYAILGDSRAVGFSYFHFLEFRRILASGGDTIRRIPERFEDLERLQPSCVFFCYGLNDAGIGYWKDGETYAAEYMEMLDKVRELLPDALLVVSSTLPVTQEALRRSPAWKRIVSFNECVCAACPAHGAVFVDNDALAAYHMDSMWSSDGVHLKEEFYPYWANNLMAGLSQAKAMRVENSGRSSAEETEQ